MKVGIISGASLRHNALASYLNQEYEVIQFSEVASTNNKLENQSLREYFSQVKLIENEKFNGTDWTNENYKKISIPKGELNNLPEEINYLFNCEVVIIYGSSIIKDPLYSMLPQNKLLNLHLGISPQYTGSACNFWALYDDNIQYVGGTIQTLSKKLDLGKTIKYCYPQLNIQTFNPVNFSMEAVKETFLNLPEVIDKIDKYIEESREPDSKKLIRHSKIADFNEKILSEFYKKEINLENINKRNKNN